MIKIKRVERKRKGNRVNQSGSGEPAGSRTAIKGHKGPVLFISFFPSLSKVKNSRKKREKLSPLSSKAGRRRWKRGGRSSSGTVAGHSAAAPELLFIYF